MSARLLTPPFDEPFLLGDRIKVRLIVHTDRDGESFPYHSYLPEELERAERGVQWAKDLRPDEFVVTLGEETLGPEIDEALLHRAPGIDRLLFDAPMHPRLAKDYRSSGVMADWRVLIRSGRRG